MYRCQRPEPSVVICLNLSLKGLGPRADLYGKPWSNNVTVGALDLLTQFLLMDWCISKLFIFCVRHESERNANTHFHVSRKHAGTDLSPPLFTSVISFVWLCDGIFFTLRCCLQGDDDIVGYITLFNLSGRYDTVRVKCVDTYWYRYCLCMYGLEVVDKYGQWAGYFPCLNRTY